LGFQRNPRSLIHCVYAIPQTDPVTRKKRSKFVRKLGAKPDGKRLYLTTVSSETWSLNLMEKGFISNNSKFGKKQLTEPNTRLHWYMKFTHGNNVHVKMMFSLV
jgi:hypothetical protein